MYQIEFTLPKNTPKELLNTLSDLFENISVFEETETQDWLVRIIYELKPPEGIEEDILIILNEMGLTSDDIKLAELPQIDWLAENRKSFPAMQIGSFYIFGSHLEPSNDRNLISIQLDASLAFGTGRHATTQGCLELIENLAPPNSNASILDLGCGTALLAIAMAKRWALPVLATDIDTDSVVMASKNIAINEVSCLVEAIEANGFDSEAIKHKSPFDLIVANILADPLIELAPDMKRYSGKGTTLILSGLLVTQIDKVVEAYKNNGFQLIEAKQIEDWAALLLKRTD